MFVKGVDETATLESTLLPILPNSPELFPVVVVVVETFAKGLDQLAGANGVALSACTLSPVPPKLESTTLPVSPRALASALLGSVATWAKGLEVAPAVCAVKLPKGLEDILPVCPANFANGLEASVFWFAMLANGLDVDPPVLPAKDANGLEVAPLS
jgi:hypothetical protein